VLEGRGYTKASDVYSFGMVCWEIVSRQIPFGHLDNQIRIAAAVLAGERPTIPHYTQQAYAKLILSTWHPDPTQRPSFPDIIDYLTREFPQVYII